MARACKLGGDLVGINPAWTRRAVREVPPDLAQGDRGHGGEEQRRENLPMRLDLHGPGDARGRISGRRGSNAPRDGQQEAHLLDPGTLVYHFDQRLHLEKE